MLLLIFFQNEHEIASLSTLELTPIPEDDGKTLVCRAENSRLPHAAIEDRWKLRVNCETL